MARLPRSKPGGLPGGRAFRAEGDSKHKLKVLLGMCREQGSSSQMRGRNTWKRWRWTRQLGQGPMNLEDPSKDLGFVLRWEPLSL